MDQNEACKGINEHGLLIYPSQKNDKKNMNIFLGSINIIIFTSL